MRHSFPWRWSVLSCAMTVMAVIASAQAAGPKSALQQNTNELVALTAQYQHSPAADKAALAEELQTLALQRQQILSAAMESDPSQVLTNAISPDLAATMPAWITNSLERNVELQGILEVAVEDSAKGSKIHYGLRTASEKLTLHFASHPPDLLSGSQIRVKGVRVGTALALNGSDSTSSVTTMSAAAANSVGAQKTLVILVNFQDLAQQPYTLQAAYDVAFNQTSNFDLENSFQQTWLTGDVVGWYTIPVSSTTCDYTSIASAAQQAATAAGVNLSNYGHYIYGFPGNACSWWGLGTVGGSPTEAWINGTFSLKVVGHEFGHNLGLYHSHAWSCGATTLGSNCSSVEYGDTLDIMGNPSAAHFTASQKERLGWLNVPGLPSITTVTASGNYTIGPYETQDSTPKALKILQSTDPTTGALTYYYVEYRQALGADSFLSNDSNVLTGVVIHTSTNTDPNSSELLNMSPALNSFYTPALDVGQSFVDSTAGVTIQTVSVTSTSATVNVTLGTPTCNHANPILSITPAQSQAVLPGTSVTYNLSLTDADSPGCAPSTFSVAASVPSGWNAVVGNPSVTLNPGANATTSVQVTSPSSAGNGSYSVGVTANNSTVPGYSSSASATYSVAIQTCSHANPTVSMTPGQSQLMLPGSSTTYTVSIVNNDSQGCAASGFSLAASVPSGWTSTVSSTIVSLLPGTSASTALQIASPTNAAAGTYTIGSSATNSGAVTYAGTATATYVLTSPVTVTLTTNALTYSRSQTVYLTATVKKTGAAVSGASVTIKITQPDSTGYQYVVSTGSNGTATLKFRLGKLSPVGTYKATATTTMSGTISSAATTFLVQ